MSFIAKILKLDRKSLLILTSNLVVRLQINSFNKNCFKQLLNNIIGYQAI